ncbi:unnamed protein product [Parnassius mnemosyne]|uniref:CCHC-type domain-containing protein n=1 Tax=Parnassius mnemosyne TaxID=213953 RepID=A0AAV1LCL0_9NEOP
MTEEKELIKKRGSFKGRLTAFISYVDSLTTPLQNHDATELELRMGKLDTLYNQYDEVQLRLECIVDKPDLQLTERSCFETQYYKALAKAQILLSDHHNANSESAGSDKSSRVSNHKFVKLPTIQLPKFSGSYENWLEFHDTFSSLIHSNDEIDEINKFHYLRASLEGSAAVVIQSFEFSASNYTVAWNVLCERFSNKRLLVQNHVSALFNLETITRESSVTLKRLIDLLSKNLRALESLGEPVQYWDTLLIYIVTHKLDQKTYREWEEFKGHLKKDESVTFNIFLQFMRSRADLLETLETSRNFHFAPNRPSPKLKSMVSVQQSNIHNINSNKQFKGCYNCNGDHNLGSCPQFLALSNEARLKLLSSYKICYNCFKSGHFANHCKKPGCKI